MRYSLRRRLPYLLVIGVLVFQVAWFAVVFSTWSAVPQLGVELEKKGRSDCDCQRCYSEAHIVTAPSLHGEHKERVPASNTSKAVPRILSSFFLIIVLSGVEGQARRDAIRNTWAKDLPSKTVIRFSVGTHGLTNSQFTDLLKEEEQHSDMMFLSDLQESYHNLTRKVLYSFAWADKNAVFSYVMKCDDDSFVLAKNVTRELNERQSMDSYYWGFFNGRANPKRKGKWHEKDWFLCDYYLPYALGGGYVLSADLVHSVALNANRLQLYSSEDVSVGVWLSGYQAERRHDTRFNTEFVSRGCRNVYLVSHKQSVEDMLTKHQLLQTTGKQCEKEFQTRLSYEYQWDTPPSMCCDRQQGIP